MTMAESTTDHSILKKIQGLVHEEQHLYGKGELADHDQVRLEAIKIELDQCWDLLRQREARKRAGARRQLERRCRCLRRRDCGVRRLLDRGLPEGHPEEHRADAHPARRR